MTNSHIFQILDHRAPQRALSSGFGVLDNSSGERPDWFEYWPIRQFLLTTALDDAAFYGFLSLDFASKTNLTAPQVLELIQQCDAETEVILFSPGIDSSAQFLNAFESAEAEHPGLIATTKRLFERIDRHTDLDELVNDSRNTAHTDYLVAKPRFWREWLALNEQMFAIAEAGTGDLGRALTSYAADRGRGKAQMKVLIMEQIASLVLASDASFATRVRTFVARDRVYKPPLAIVQDALKIAYRTQGFCQYKEVLRFVRAQRKFWNFEIKLGSWIAFRSARANLRRSGAIWEDKGP